MIGLLLHAREQRRLDVYTVHEGPEPAADRIDRAEELEFVKDGFDWGIALFSPFVFLLRGEWAALGVYLAVLTVLAGLLSLCGASSDWIGLAVVGLNVFAGFEASTIERAILNYRGYGEIGTVTGRNRNECERRFFESWLADQPALSVTRAAPRDQHAIASGLGALFARWRGTGA